AVVVGVAPNVAVVQFAPPQAPASGTPVELTSPMLGHSNEACTLHNSVHPGQDRSEGVIQTLVRALDDDGSQSVCNPTVDDATA
ncbi:MAG: hypothetical protein ACLPVY_17440, partial [Acidimicrobiia bacterium]